MENIFTNTQVSGYPLIKSAKAYLLILFTILWAPSFAQKLSTENKKCIKLYHKAEEALIDRDFRSAIHLFQQSIKRDSSFREPYSKLASIYNIYQNKDSALLYTSGYVRVTPKEKVGWKTWKNLAYLNFEQGNYVQANLAIKELLADKPEHLTDPDLKLLMESIAFSIEASKNPLDINIAPLPDEVNMFGLQYFPVLTVDGGTLIFTKRDNNGPNSDEDIVFSTKTNTGWSQAKSISKEINSELNEGACTVSADGRTLIFTSCDEGRTFGNCDLFVTNRLGDQWSKPENMGSVINSSYWDSQPSLSADGRTLYFSSNRPGGFGKRDLWVSNYSAKGWSTPRNLGHEINRSRDETTPFIHANSNVLFFSSNSYPGLGGYDLYFTKRQNNIWGEVKNLGYPINTKNDEVSVFVASNGTDAYYAQEQFAMGRIVESKIVHFEIFADSLGITRASYITGQVTNATSGEPLLAELELMNLNDSSDIYIAKSDSLTGYYFLTITEGREYGVFVEKRNFLFENFSFEAKNNSILSPDTINIELRPIQVGKTVILQNIYFEFDQHKLDSKSLQELGSIVGFMNSNPGIKFEIEGHTDNRGSSAYNLDLSQKRAESVRNYLVQKGIDSNRLSAVGYGSSILLSEEKSETAHKLNRRIVFQVRK